MNSVKSTVSEKLSLQKKESIIPPTKPTNSTNEKSWRIKWMIITEITFLKVFNKSTKKTPKATKVPKWPV